MKKSNSNCELCESLRGLNQHLYEVGKIGELLSNSLQYEEEDGARVIDTFDISQWLTLSSQLESVDINMWKFAGSDGTWCRPAAEMYDSDSKHYSLYCTSLTKFIYTYNVLEELFKYLHPYTKNVKQLSKVRSHSIRAAMLLGNEKNLVTPSHSQHFFNSFTNTFKVYNNRFNKSVTFKIEDDSVSYALDNLRVLRNHIAHGTFPIASNPDYSSSSNEMQLLCVLLAKATRCIGLYIQIIYLNYNQGFRNIGGLFVDTIEPNNVEKFLLSHLTSLHLETDFGLNPEQFSLWEDQIIESNLN